MTSWRELLDAARPDCAHGDCEQRVQRVEQTWIHDPDRGWILKADAVCEWGHRVPVQTLRPGEVD